MCTDYMRRTKRPSLPLPPVDGDFGFPLGAGVAVLATIVSVATTRAADAITHPWLSLA